MLPGFRFLFTAIVLTMSILVFGLGAAALLRAAHEQFANLTTRRVPPERMFARQNDIPTLALLRVEPLAEKAPDAAPANAADSRAAAERNSDEDAAEAAKLTALKAEEPPQPADTARPGRSVVEANAETPSASAQTDVPPASADIKLAALTDTGQPDVPAAPSAVTAEAVVAAPPIAALAIEGNVAATKIATLGGPAVIIEETTSSKPTSATPDRGTARKRTAQRAREKRRIARRARLAREAALAAQQTQQQQASPFEQAPVARRTR
jgi:hypothetical protein